MIELNKNLAEYDGETLRSLIKKHKVLLLKDQNPDTWAEEVTKLGTINTDGKYSTASGMIHVNNLGKKYEINRHWHFDDPFSAEVPKYTALYGHCILPTGGGRTGFIDQTLVWESLADNIKAFFRTLGTCHTVTRYDMVVSAMLDGRTHIKMENENTARAFEAKRPLVLEEDGIESILMVRTLCDYVYNLGKHPKFIELTYNQPLRDWISSYQETLDYGFEHKWEEKDLLLYDNRRLLHRVIHDYGDSDKRELKRLLFT